jgi:hypothetical protein
MARPVAEVLARPFADLTLEDIAAMIATVGDLNRDDVSENGGGGTGTVPPPA